VICRVVVSEALWLLGYPEQALSRNQEALILAQASSHIYSRVFALNWATMLHLLRREAHIAHERAQAAITAAREQGFAHLEAVTLTLWGGTLTALEDDTGGIPQMRRGLTVCRTTGAELVRPYLLALVAEAYAREGQNREGLRVVDEAFTVGRKTGEQWYEAELYRLQGELTLAGPRDWRRKTRPPSPQTSNLQPQAGWTGGGGVLSHGFGDCPATGHEVTGVAGGNELESLVAATRQKGSSAKAISRDLRLVHGRTRHGRFAEREGTTDRTHLIGAVFLLASL